MESWKSQPSSSSIKELENLCDEMRSVLKIINQDLNNRFTQANNTPSRKIMVILFGLFTVGFASYIWAGFLERDPANPRNTLTLVFCLALTILLSDLQYWGFRSSPLATLSTEPLEKALALLSKLQTLREMQHINLETSIDSFMKAVVYLHDNYYYPELKELNKLQRRLTYFSNNKINNEDIEISHLEKPSFPNNSFNM